MRFLLEIQLSFLQIPFYLNLTEDRVALLLHQNNNEYFEDLEATNIVQPGSRVEYNYLFEGPEAEISKVQSFLESVKESG